MLTRSLAPASANVLPKGSSAIGVKWRAIFDFSVPVYFTEGFPVLQEFCAAGFACTVLLEWGGRGAREAAEQCRKLNCAIIDLPWNLLYHVDDVPSLTAPNGEGEAVGIADPTNASAPSIRRRVHRWLTRRLPFAARSIELIWSLPHLMRLRRLGEKLIRELKPDVLIFGPFNSHGRASNALFAAAKRSGIPTICIPFAPLMGEPYQIVERAESVRRGAVAPTMRADYDLFNRVCATLLRSWTRTDGTIRLFHRDPVELISGRLAGLLFTDGWQKPSPYFDRVFVPSEHSLHCLQIANYPMDKVVLSGMPRMDAIVKSLTDDGAKREFFASIRLPFGTRFIVLNVEPAAEHRIASWELHWCRFRETMDALVGHGMPIVLSLHPLCAPENYEFVEAEYGVIVRHSRSIYDLVAHSTIVVSNICSTLLTTEMFCKPTLVYDFHSISDKAAKFFGVDRHLVCRDAATLAGELRRLVTATQSDTSGAVKLPLAREVIREDVLSLLARRLRRPVPIEAQEGG